MLRLISGSLLIIMLSLNVLSANSFKKDDVFDQFRDLDRNKGTFLYFTDIYQCIGCNSDNVSNTIMPNNKLNPNNNHILVVRFLQNEERLFFEKKFKIKYVIADPDGSITKEINPTFKTSIFLDSLSDIDNVHKDINTDSGISYNLNNGTVVRDIQINDLEQPIIRAFKTVILEGTSTFAILDDLQNMIYFIDLSSGQIIHKYEDDGTLKYYFFKDTTANKNKKSFDEMATPVIANLYMDPRSRKINSLVMAYSIEKKIQQNIEKNSIDTFVVLRPKMINLKFIDSVNNKIDTISSDADYSIYKNMIGSKIGIICERDNITKSKSDTLLPVLFQIDYNFRTISHLLMDKDLQAQINCPFDYNYGGDFAISKENEIYYLNSMNSIYLKFNPENINSNITFIEPEGTLKDVFRENKCESKKENVNSYFCAGMASYNNKLAVYLAKSNDLGNITEQKIQIYHNDKFISEFDPKFNNDGDTLLKSYLIGHKDEEILILNKWKNKRWIISKLEVD
jgi:hypothetical protein